MRSCIRSVADLWSKGEGVIQHLARQFCGEVVENWVILVETMWKIDAFILPPPTSLTCVNLE
jgi:hypothetical protein